MQFQISRRTLVTGLAAPALSARFGLDRLGIMCQLPPEETPARNVLRAAHAAGFRRAQITFPWDRVSAEFLKRLPRWTEAENLQVDALGAYVNCAEPGNVIMSARASDFDRALDYAHEIGAMRLVAGQVASERT